MHNNEVVSNSSAQGVCAGCGAVHNGRVDGNYVDLFLTEGSAPFCSTACITAFVKSEAGQARLKTFLLDDVGGNPERTYCSHCSVTVPDETRFPAICCHPDGTVTEDTERPTRQEMRRGMRVLILDAGYGPYDGGAAFCEASCLVNSFLTDEPDWDAKGEYAHRSGR